MTDDEFEVGQPDVDAEGEPVKALKAFYSLNGGGSWRPALATQDTITQELATQRLIVTAIQFLLNPRIGKSSRGELVKAGLTE